MFLCSNKYDSQWVILVIGHYHSFSVAMFSRKWWPSYNRKGCFHYYFFVGILQEYIILEILVDIHLNPTPQWETVQPMSFHLQWIYTCSFWIMYLCAELWKFNINTCVQEPGSVCDCPKVGCGHRVSQSCFTRFLLHVLHLGGICFCLV